MIRSRSRWTKPQIPVKSLPNFRRIRWTSYRGSEQTYSILLLGMPDPLRWLEKLRLEVDVAIIREERVEEMRDGPFMHVELLLNEQADSGLRDRLASELARLPRY